jgi:hypothetical protein
VRCELCLLRRWTNGKLSALLRAARHQFCHLLRGRAATWQAEEVCVPQSRIDWYSRPQTLVNAIDEEDGRSNEELGVIRVVVRRCIPLSYDAQATFMPFNSRSAVNEKSQKGLIDIRTEYVYSLLVPILYDQITAGRALSEWTICQCPILRRWKSIYRIPLRL